MWIWIILIGIVAIVIWLIKTNKEEAKVELKIATFGFDLSVYDLELSGNSFSIYVDLDNSGNKIRFFGNTIGTIQFRISKACKRYAQERDGNDFKIYNTDYCRFTVGVTNDGERLTYEQFFNLISSQMLSRKNPIASIERYEHSAPLTGYGEIVHREKL